jgi:hypothetical protein
MYIISKEQLYLRICDVIEGATNTQTFMEFIIEGYKSICGITYAEEEILDFNIDEINERIEEVDWLLDK